MWNDNENSIPSGMHEWHSAADKVSVPEMRKDSHSRVPLGKPNNIEWSLGTLIFLRTQKMRTSATYMFDKQSGISEVSVFENKTACIEFRGNDNSSSRKHYIRIEGISSKECQILSEKLKKVAKFLKKGKK